MAIYSGMAVFYFFRDTGIHYKFQKTESIYEDFKS